jgi:hypothetical protein
MTQTLPYLLAMSAIASQVVESRWVPDLQKRIEFGNAGPSSSADKGEKKYKSSRLISTLN